MCCLITWDIDLAVELDLANCLCATLESIQLSCADCLMAANFKSKVYHNCITQLFEVEFAKGDLAISSNIAKANCCLKWRAPKPIAAMQTQFVATRFCLMKVCSVNCVFICCF